MIAAEYLYDKGVLKEVVCDPLPSTWHGKDRKEQLEKLGIKVSNKMPPIAKYVFVGGALTELARYLINHKIDCLVINGGFVGSNIVKNPLDKFKDKQVIRTFNFNCDVAAADAVLKSKNIENVILVGKNVCYSEKNTLLGVWGNEKRLLEKYHSKPDKRQHDMLACREGLIMLGMLDEELYLDYKIVCPYNKGLNGSMTEWEVHLLNRLIEVCWRLWIGDKIKMSNDCKIVVDTNEFQQKVLDYINSDDIDKMISNTVFADKPECKSAIIHGMSIASMLTSACKLMYVREYKEEEKCMLSASEAKAKTQNNINDGVTAELNKINILIENYITAGKFSFSKDGSLEPETRRKLEELGYDVKTDMQKNESYYSISWR